MAERSKLWTDLFGAPKAPPEPVAPQQESAPLPPELPELPIAGGPQAMAAEAIAPGMQDMSANNSADMQNQNAALQAEIARLKAEMARMKKPDFRGGVEAVMNKASSYKAEHETRIAGRNGFRDLWNKAKQGYDWLVAAEHKVEAPAVAIVRTITDSEVRQQAVDLAVNGVEYAFKRGGAEVKAAAGDVYYGGKAILSGEVARGAQELELALSEKAETSVVAAAAELFAGSFRQRFAKGALAATDKAVGIRSGLDAEVEGVMRKHNLNTPDSDVVGMAWRAPDALRFKARERAEDLVRDVEGPNKPDMLTLIENQPRNLREAIVVEIAMHDELLHQHLLRGDQQELIAARERVHSIRDAGSPEMREALDAMNAATQAYQSKIDRVGKIQPFMVHQNVRRSVRMGMEQVYRYEQRTRLEV